MIYQPVRHMVIVYLGKRGAYAISELFLKATMKSGNVGRTEGHSFIASAS